VEADGICPFGMPERRDRNREQEVERLDLVLVGPSTVVRGEGTEEPRRAGRNPAHGWPIQP